MDVLNPIGLVLGIISSALSIYAFIQKRMRPSPAAEPRPAPHRTTATAAPPAPPRLRTPSARRFGQVAAVVWALLGLGCLSEGLTFGEPVLLIFGAGFLWLARYCWRG